MTLLDSSDASSPLQFPSPEGSGVWRGLRVGAELEFFVVDRETLQPRDHLDLLLEGMDEGTIKPEIAREHVELVTPAVTSLRELEKEARALVRAAGRILDGVEAALLPLALWDTVAFTLTDLPRYHRLVEVFGPVFWKNASTILADQINLGAADEEQAFRVFRAVRVHLPLFMGLSAASPFEQGRPNGIASNRMHRYDACTTRHPDLGGIPPDLRSMADYRRHLEDQPVLPHPNMFYRYARPMPHRGVAAEIRCIDKQPTLARFMAFAALARAVAAEALGEGDDASGRTASPHPEEPLPPTRDLTLRFRGARDRGVLDPAAWEERLDDLALRLPSADRPYLEPLRRSVEEGPPATALREAVEERGMQPVLADLADGYLEDPVGRTA